MAQATAQRAKEYAIEEFLVRSEPYYREVGDELALFTAAYNQHIPVLLKGPTGCGKTRFVEYMAWKLSRPVTLVKGSKGKKKGRQGHTHSDLRVPCCVSPPVGVLELLLYAVDVPGRAAGSTITCL